MRLPNLTHLLDALAGRRQARDADDDPLVDVGIRAGPYIRGLPRRTSLPKKPPPPECAGPSSVFTSLLVFMRTTWDDHGATDRRISPTEFCTLPKVKAPHLVVAVPHRDLWPWTANLVKEVWTPLRDVCGPMSVRGYRPPEYNEAVGGSHKSDHMWAVALDLRPAGGQGVDLLKLEAAKLYLQRGRELKIGFGVYRANIHLGVGLKRRHWGDARRWIEKARRA